MGEAEEWGGRSASRALGADRDAYLRETREVEVATPPPAGLTSAFDGMAQAMAQAAQAMGRMGEALVLSPRDMRVLETELAALGPFPQPSRSVPGPGVGMRMETIHGMRVIVDPALRDGEAYVVTDEVLRSYGGLGLPRGGVGLPRSPAPRVRSTEEFTVTGPPEVMEWRPEPDPTPRHRLQADHAGRALAERLGVKGYGDALERELAAQATRLRDEMETRILRSAGGAGLTLAFDLGPMTNTVANSTVSTSGKPLTLEGLYDAIHALEVEGRIHRKPTRPVAIPCDDCGSPNGGSGGAHWLGCSKVDPLG